VAPTFRFGQSSTGRPSDPWLEAWKFKPVKRKTDRDDALRLAVRQLVRN